MLEPILPFLGVPPNMQLVDPLTVFTPLTAALVALCSLLGIALGMFIDRTDISRTIATPRPATAPALSKAA
jgi:hypothetical protein